MSVVVINDTCVQEPTTTSGVLVVFTEQVTISFIEVAGPVEWLYACQ